jgi:putative membrane protein
MMHGWDVSGWGWVWMSVWMVFGVLAVALLVLLITRGVTQGTTQAKPEDDAVAVLRRRFAAGEIDQEEFRRRRLELERS